MKKDQYGPGTRFVHTEVKSSTMEPRSQDTFTSVYRPQFPSTTTSVDISPPRYSFIACACARMNELKTRIQVRSWMCLRGLASTLLKLVSF